MSQELSLFAKKLGIAVLAVAAIALAYELRTLVAILGFSAFLTALFSPALAAAEKSKIPTSVAVLLIYAAIFLLAATVFATTLPIFATQIAALLSGLSNWAENLQNAYASGGVPALNLPGFLVPVAELFDPASVFSAIRDNAADIARSSAAFLSSLGSKGAGVFAAIGARVTDVVLTLVFTFFLSLERRRTYALFHSILPAKVSELLKRKEAKISRMLSSWLRGQAFLALSIFVLTLFGLFVLEFAFGVRLQNRFALALIAGICEFVPYVGPLLALLPALAIASGFGMGAIGAVAILYVVIQQAENHVLVPWLMGRALNLSPFYVVVMTTAGAMLGGIVGIILAMPVAGILSILLENPDSRPSKKLP